MKQQSRCSRYECSSRISRPRNNPLKTLYVQPHHLDSIAVDRGLTLMKRVLILISVLGAISTSYASQFSAGGTISALRNHTLFYPISTLQGVSILQLSSAFANGCSWVFIGASDKTALSVALAAKAAGSSVTITYDNSITSPWGDTSTCAVVAIQED
jgi:hypothetical protein